MVKEARDLHLEILSDYIYQDVVDGHEHPDASAVHAYIETVRDQHCHPGHQDKYSKLLEQPHTAAPR
ncbi:uncharacterized protein V1513DRAFT_422881 [Lipomyces chichibuensis]|uniref:uncharacterized protein n=1 Tax=Lipomyces chichibuensis TaxID=1546026 RepID=UPI003343B597